MKLSLRVCILVLVCWANIPVAARQTTSEELLFGSGDRLYLANITTGTTTALPNIDISSPVGFLWSPDGRYLLGNFSYSEGDKKLIRIYDVDNANWTHEIKVEIGITYIAWSSDSTQFAYAKPVKYDSLQSDGQLWIFDLETGTQQLLYKTKVTGDRALTDTGIKGIWWSPDSQLLLFGEYVSKMGNADTGLNLITVTDKTIKQMVRPWRGGFNPVWSPDSKWFVLNLPDTLYFPSDPNDLGDVVVYGVNERIYGLTNTPDTVERNLHWSSDSRQIKFEVDNNLVTIELQAVIDNPKSFEQQLSLLPPKPKYFGDADFPSPDGQWIAYLLRQSDNTIDLYTVRPDGSNDSKLAEAIIFFGWRPS